MSLRLHAAEAAAVLEDGIEEADEDQLVDVVERVATALLKAVNRW